MLVGVVTSKYIAARKKGTSHGWLVAIGRYEATRRPSCISFVQRVLWEVKSDVDLSDGLGAQSFQLHACGIEWKREPTRR
jgi:hypothetical protein